MSYWKDKPRNQPFGYSDQGHDIHDGKVPFLNLDMLQNEGRDSKKIDRQIFKLILARCHKHIKRINRETESRECRYSIPYFMPGYPAYKLRDAKEYLVTHLRENGLRADLLDGQDIYISWAPQEINHDIYQNKIDKMAERTNIYKIGISPLVDPPRAHRKSKSSNIIDSQNSEVSLLQLDPKRPDFIPVNTKVLKSEYPELVEKTKSSDKMKKQLQAQEKTSIFRERLREQRERGRLSRSSYTKEEEEDFS